MRSIHRSAALLAFFAVVGCQRPEGEKLLPVAGIISVDAKPVTTGNTTFYPDKSKGNATQHQPTGVIDANGKYELFVPGGRKGAPPGWYKVVVYAIDDPQPGKPNKYLVHRDYADVTTTVLRIEVIENPESGRYDMKLVR